MEIVTEILTWCIFTLCIMDLIGRYVFHIDHATTKQIWLAMVPLCLLAGLGFSAQSRLGWALMYVGLGGWCLRDYYKAEEK